MQSVYLKFYVSEKQRHDGKMLYEWLLEEAKRQGMPGGSVFRAIAGFGRHGHLHEETFFELAGELPLQIEFVLEAGKADHLLDSLRSQNLNLFYVRYPVETGTV
jgi:PII-like signaling protein